MLSITHSKAYASCRRRNTLKILSSFTTNSVTANVEAYPLNIQRLLKICASLQSKTPRRIETVSVQSNRIFIATCHFSGIGPSLYNGCFGRHKRFTRECVAFIIVSIEPCIAMMLLQFVLKAASRRRQRPKSRHKTSYIQ